MSDTVTASTTKLKNPGTYLGVGAVSIILAAVLSLLEMRELARVAGGLAVILVATGILMAGFSSSSRRE